jgi:flagellar protein FlaI
MKRTPFSYACSINLKMPPSLLGGNSLSFIESFVWNPVNDTFEFKGYMNSYLLEYKIAPRRGIPRDKKRQIYTQVKKRAEVLERIQKQKITNFYDLHGVLSKAYREGYFR